MVRDGGESAACLHFSRRSCGCFSEISHLYHSFISFLLSEKKKKKLSGTPKNSYNNSEDKAKLVFVLSLLCSELIQYL